MSGECDGCGEHTLECMCKKKLYSKKKTMISVGYKMLLTEKREQMPKHKWMINSSEIPDRELDMSFDNLDILSGVYLERLISIRCEYASDEYNYYAGFRHKSCIRSMMVDAVLNIIQNGE